jgi:hypothetical protein
MLGRMNRFVLFVGHSFVHHEVIGGCVIFTILLAGKLPLAKGNRTSSHLLLITLGKGKWSKRFVISPSRLIAFDENESDKKQKIENENNKKRKREEEEQPQESKQKKHHTRRTSTRGLVLSGLVPPMPIHSSRALSTAPRP